jgi:putative ABC transport system permease protein
VLGESLLLACLGCIVGVFFAVWGVSLLRGAAGSMFPRLDSAGVDGGVLLFALGVSLALALLFGLVPALRLPRINLAEALKGGGRTASAQGHHRLRTTLVAIEVAASMVLLAGAGLLARSMWQILGTERGFDVNNVLTLRLPLAAYRYPAAEQREAFVRQVVENIAALPQVECAGLVQQPPLTGDADIHTISLEGRPARPGEEPIAEIRYISPGYFQAIRLPLRRGRLLTSGDGKDQPRVAVVNETLARRFWPGEDPIGKRFRLGSRANIPWFSAVGVVADARQAGLDKEARPQVFVSFDQDTFSSMAVVVRTRTDPASAASAVREEIRKLDPAQPVLGMKTLTGILDESIADRRLHAVVLGAFAIFSLLLAAVGLHGVIAYSAAQRAREFAIRIALGADRRSILWMILSEGLRLGLIGMLAGAACSAALGRLLEGLLYGVRPADAPTFAAVSALLLLCCLIASLVPARRAMTVDPVVTLNEA